MRYGWTLSVDELMRLCQKFVMESDTIDKIIDKIDKIDNFLVRSMNWQQNVNNINTEDGGIASQG